jgi:hypothetical protein
MALFFRRPLWGLVLLLTCICGANSRADQLTNKIDFSMATETDGQYVYYLEMGGDVGRVKLTPGIYRLPVSGGDPKRIFTTQGRPTVMKLLDGKIYFADDAGNIGRINLDGSSFDQLATQQGEVSGLNVRPSDLFWISSSVGVVQMSMSERIPHQLATAQPCWDYGNLVTLKDTVFWITCYPSSVWMLELGTGKSPNQVYSQGALGIGNLSADEKNVYWYGSPGIFEYDGVNGVVKTIYSERDQVRAPVSDGQYLYWVAGDGLYSGSIMKAPVAGGNPTVLVQDKEHASAKGLSLDTNHIYGIYFDGIFSVDKN